MAITDKAEPMEIALYVIGVLIGAALIFMGSQPSTRNGAALSIGGLVIVAYVAYSVYKNVIAD
ncbi:MAG: hypothetical protein ABEH64_02855 [Salinirussus sp.]